MTFDEPEILLVVDSEELDYSNEHGWTFEGQAFTGVSEERSGGILLSETTYVDGVERGLSLGWYANGQLESETFYGAPEEFSYFREWHEDGTLKSERIRRFGRQVVVRRHPDLEDR